MSRPSVIASWAAVLALAGCSQPAPTQEAQPEAAPTVHSGGLNRSVLPIVEQKSKPIRELDARNAQAPEPFNVNAPEGAPNVVIVLIDDIGFGATTPFGGKIESPSLDRLAEDGLKFTQFHTTALCSPTRAALKSGRNHHATNVGSVMEIATGFPGNQGQIPADVVPLAEILRQNGYSTGAFGKWHETAPWEVSVSGPYDRWPTGQGFDKFYGFIGGETNQYEPLIFDGVTKVDRPEGDDYHFTEDMTNEAIEWVQFQQAMTPEKPFMVYYATGAVHAPHHAPKEYIDKYKGVFDSGWDTLREETLARQIEAGLVPEGTELAPTSSDLPKWADLSDKERTLFARQMETFAGFMDHTDHQVGRLVDAIDDIGELDDTLFIYIVGDNGSSAEGGLTGTFNELVHLNGIFDVETIDSMLERLDDWGGPDSFPHMSAAWAVATDAPFGYTKQVAGDYGGTRNAMVLHWPNGMKARGENRSQWHHVVDVAPTVLQAARLPIPTKINGVVQRPMDGVSMTYAFDKPKAPSTHTTQYFEMFGNRGIYHEGWYARVLHRIPWHSEPLNTLQEDEWQLFDTTKDFSLAHNVAEQFPEKLAEMQALFEKEAIRNNVYPIDDRVYERFNAAMAGRPDLMGERRELVLTHGMTGIMENAFLNVKNRSMTIEAELDLDGQNNGTILAQGGKFGGWSLHLERGKPTFVYNWFGLELYKIQGKKALKGDRALVRLEFDYDGGGAGKGGTARVYANGELVAEGRVERTEPAVFSADETADVGVDEGTPVAPVFKDVDASRFTGRVDKVTIRVKG